VSRTVYPTVPATVEYRLTPLGASLAGAVSVIKDWAYANIEQIERAREQYDATPRQTQPRPGHPDGAGLPAGASDR
jgi:DNA-binding HxlR family transcriptional regulator